MKGFLKVTGIGLIIAVILFGVDIIFRYTTGREVPFDLALLKTLGFYVMYSIPITFVNSYYFDYLNHRVKWVRYRKYRITIGIVGSISLTLITVFLIRIFHRTVVNGQTLEEVIATERIANYFGTIIITIVAVLFFHAFYFYKQLQDRKVKEQKIIAGTASAKFDALKNQLDPHFLFNSLNVLTSLIDENPDNAQEFTTSLSKIYRYVLEQKNKDLVTLDEELEFAKIYMSLLKMRFEDSIIFEIPDRASIPESKVVPLSLQLLLENAVKHNVVTSSKPLQIKIYESGGHLVVENNLQPKQIIKKSSGVGLSNIMQRYQLLTHREVNIQKETNSFAVAIPVLTKQIKTMRTQSKSQLDDSYVRARKHVEELKEFYYNLISYCLVIPFLIFINYKTSWGFQWFWFPMLGWGLGLLLHGYKVFVNDGFLGGGWEKRKIDQFMREEEERTWR
jgi:sensor histidine kinase YesM